MCYALHPKGDGVAVPADAVCLHSCVVLVLGIRVEGLAHVVEIVSKCVPYLDALEARFVRVSVGLWGCDVVWCCVVCVEDGIAVLSGIVWRVGLRD